MSTPSTAAAPLPSISRTTPLLTVDETARLLRLKRSRVYALVRSGSIPHLRIGKTIRFALDELNAYLAEQSRKTGKVA